MMEYMYDEFDKDNITFVLDTCWVANSGADVCEWIEKLQGRLDILHLKDIRSINLDGWSVRQEMCEIGNGLICWDKVLKTAQDTGVKYCVVEQDRFWVDDDPFKSLEISANYLKKFFK
jgi:sugar phosphate isomerase/epimerase